MDRIADVINNMQGYLDARGLIVSVSKEVRRFAITSAKSLGITEKEHGDCMMRMPLLLSDYPDIVREEAPDNPEGRRSAKTKEENNQED